MQRPVLDVAPQAIDEVWEAREWYLARSPAAADAFMAEIDAAVGRVLDRPDSHPGYRYGTRYCMLRRFPYLLIYRHSQGVVQIVAVAHAKRRPGYWKSRLRK